MRNITYLFIICICVFIFSTNKVYSQAGALDSTFGSGGKLTMNVSNYSSGATAAALQNDEKIVIAGTSTYNSVDWIFVARLNSNGSLDSTFGNNGIDTIRNSGVPHAIAFQNDGKIVIVGTSNSAYLLMRFDSAGNLDNSFGTGGLVSTNFTNWGNYYWNIAYTVAIQSDHKIIAAGYSGVSNATNDLFSLARYNEDGSLDSTFGIHGEVLTDFGISNSHCYSIAVQSDGKIVAAGETFDGSDYFGFARYKTDGSIDSTFGTYGKVKAAIGNVENQIQSVVLQNDGKIVAGGYILSGGNNYEFVLIRLKTDGSIDSSYGTNGHVTTNTGTIAIIFTIVIQGDGKIVAVGDANSEFSLSRYNINGSLDSTFGTNGLVSTAFAGSDHCAGGIIQNDGKVIAFGWGEMTGSIEIARYKTDILTSINENITEDLIQIYPNPSSDKLRIKRSELINIKIEIYDALGKRIYQSEIQDQQFEIDISHLLSGIYFLQLKSKDERTVKKFIKR